MKEWEFKIKDSKGQEKVISRLLGNFENRIPESENIKLTIEGIANTVFRGDILEVYGTAIPGSAVIVEIVNPESITTNTRTAEVDNAGKWKLSDPINIALMHLLENIVLQFQMEIIMQQKLGILKQTK